MHSMGQVLEIEVFDKDEGNDDDKLGRWVCAPRTQQGAGASGHGRGWGDRVAVVARLRMLHVSYGYEWVSVHW